MVLDIDSTLVEVHSENKAQAAAHFKGGFGFHPMLCVTDDGEPLSMMLRPGNAAANSICDHIEVLDAAVAQLPAAVSAGHREGDDAETARRRVQLRVDSAGCSTHIAAACRARNVEFFMTARSNNHLTAAIDCNRIDPDKWQQALRRDQEPAQRAQVAELTDFVDLSDWPDKTRFIARREPLHPGAQRSLFDSGAWRYCGFYTDALGDPAELDAHHRAHARINNTIADLKDSGLARMPFSDYHANTAWAAMVAFSLTLVKWFQQLCLTGPLAKASPNASAGSYGTHPQGSCAPHANGPCACSTGGQQHHNYCTPAGPAAHKQFFAPRPDTAQNRPDAPQHATNTPDQTPKHPPANPTHPKPQPPNHTKTRTPNPAHKYS